MEMAAVKVDDKVELHAEIFGSKKDDLNLRASRIKFEEITKMYKQDEVGDGFCTLTLGQAKKLRTDLGIVIEKFE